MNNLFLNQKTPNEIAKDLAEKIKQQRKKLKVSQLELAQKSVSVLEVLKGLKQSMKFHLFR